MVASFDFSGDESMAVLEGEIGFDDSALSSLDEVSLGGLDGAAFPELDGDLTDPELVAGPLSGLLVFSTVLSAGGEDLLAVPVALALLS